MTQTVAAPTIRIDEREIPRAGDAGIHNPPVTCPQCGATTDQCPDPWQHERDYRSSETTWWAAAVTR